MKKTKNPSAATKQFPIKHFNVSLIDESGLVELQVVKHIVNKGYNEKLIEYPFYFHAHFISGKVRSFLVESPMGFNNLVDGLYNAGMEAARKVYGAA